jgi:hypothetical protein
MEGATACHELPLSHVFFTPVKRPHQWTRVWQACLCIAAASTTHHSPVTKARTVSAGCAGVGCMTYNKACYLQLTLAGPR